MTYIRHCRGWHIMVGISSKHCVIHVTSLITWRWADRLARYIFFKKIVGHPLPISNSKYVHAVIKHVKFHIEYLLRTGTIKLTDDVGSSAFIDMSNTEENDRTFGYSHN